MQDFEHFFRHESGHLTAPLTKVFGLGQLSLIEDVVQESLIDAFERWKFQAMPENPSGWLYRVARNKAIDRLRRDQRFAAVSEQAAWHLDSDRNLGSNEGGPDKDMRRDEREREEEALMLLFAVAHPALSQTSQIALLLKTLGGFSVPEISRALFTPEEAVAKRLFRARQTLKAEAVVMEMPEGEGRAERVEAARTALYLLFNEGCHASHPDEAIRRDLCFEALRLTLILHRHPVGAEPETAALIALMALHAARLDARVGDQGELLLLDAQDRSRWDHGLIAQGLSYLDEASENQAFSRYHLEASIAGVHAVARDVASTDWRALLRLYDVMGLHFPSPVVHLNRAVVLARLEGPEQGLSALAALPDVDRLQTYHYYHAVAAELWLGVGDKAKAREHWLTAQELATNRLEKELLARKLAGLG